MHAFAFPQRVAALARRVEEWGFAGLLVADSQNLNGDVWVELALAGQATERIAVGPGVTNPFTRHPAVTACAAATLQAETGGRAVLGIGRGDSALTQIGHRPVPVDQLESAVVALQGYLSGEEVALDGATSRIGWLRDRALPKVPIVVAATGPRVIALAAKHAEGVDFTVGAEPARLRWAIETAKGVVGEREVGFGAYLNVAVHPDRKVARDLVRGSTAILARFSTEGGPTDGLSETTRSGIGRLVADYDERQHGQGAAGHAQQLEDDFIDRFALVGPAHEVVERLGELRELGLQRIVVVAGSLDADPSLVADANARFAEEVLPHLS